MRFAIIGVGGVGGPFGAALAEAGHDVTFVARGAHLDAIRRNGLRIDGPEQVHVEGARATGDTASIGPVDAVLFTVKTFALEEAAKSLPPLLKPGAAVIALQNGVDAEERLGRLIGDAYVMGGVAEISAAISEPGVIRQVSEYKRIRFGEMDGRASARGEAILAAFQAAGLDATFTQDIQKALWTKFVMLAAMSGLTAAARATFGALRGDPETRALMAAAVGEAVAVGRAKGVDLGPDAVPRTLAWIETLPAQGRASMAIDLERGNRLELPWLSGAVVRLGKELGVPTPVHAFICAVLKLHQEGKKG